jgi:Fanconi anemia group I protein
MDFARKADKSAGKKKKTGDGKVLKTNDRRMKLIPTIVFQIEQYERQLIALSKKSHINLMKYAKRSIARDFRIQVKDLVDIAESSSEGEDNDQENDQSGDEAPLKKPRNT